MVDELLVQLGELGGGCAFGGPAAAGEDSVGELLCVLVGGVTVGPQAGDVDVVDAGGCGGPGGGQVGDVEAGEVVFDKAVGVVVGVGRGLVQIGLADEVLVEVELLLAGGCFGLFGGVGTSGSMVAAWWASSSTR